MRLPIHLPAEHPITYDPSESVDVLELRCQIENSPLMAFFRANADPGALGTEAQKYTYQEFPQHSVVKTDRTTGVKYWDFRQQGFALSHVALSSLQ